MFHKFQKRNFSYDTLGSSNGSYKGFIDIANQDVDYQCHRRGNLQLIMYLKELEKEKSFEEVQGIIRQSFSESLYDLSSSGY